MHPLSMCRQQPTSRRLPVCLIHQPWWGKPSICLGLLLLLLPCSSRSQNLITPEQAVQAVRDFWGDPTISGVVESLKDESQTYNGEVFYEVNVTNHARAGSYEIDAIQGIVTWCYLHPVIPDGEPTLTLEQAQPYAEQFLQAHFAPFNQGQWVLWPEFLIRNGDSYIFLWYKVLNGYGTLSPYYVLVKVSAVNGTVLLYHQRPYRVNGPTVPQITSQQAQQLAAPYAFYDPAVVPFSPIRLTMTGDMVGVQWLLWELKQVPDPINAPDQGPAVLIDAITGAYAGYDLVFAGSGGKEPPANPHRKRPPVHTPRVRFQTADGQKIGSFVEPCLERGRVWVRVELMRAGAARVETDAKGATVRVGERTVSGAAVGAKWREWGWWVPLRRTVQALGGRVDWLAARREAVVDLRARTAVRTAPR